MSATTASPPQWLDTFDVARDTATADHTLFIAFDELSASQASALFGGYGDDKPAGAPGSLFRVRDTLLGERTSDVFSSVAWGNDSEAGVDAGCATALARFGTILIVEPIRGHVAGFLGSCGITDGDERVRRMDYTHLSIGVDVESLVYPVATLVPVELQSVQAAEEGIVAALEWHGKVARPGDVALAMGVAGAVAPRSEFLAPSSTALFRDERRLSEDADQDDGSNGHDDGGGVEPTEVYSTTAVRMTPEIAGGFIVAFTLLFILGVILWCLMSVQAPDRFVSKPLPAGKEF